ncbi:MAG: hypothetical protein N2Z22_11835, partial [Turneriella sp.]|nr:hypothetical protein [Turneriella sp.]
MDVKHLSLTALFLTIAISCSQQKKWNVANSGVANLFAADFASGKIYELNGEWEYHPGRLLDPNAMSQLTTEKKYAHVPQSFNSYENPALQLPEKAVATYRLEIILPPKIATYTLR